MVETKFKTKILLKDTLKDLPVKESMTISNRTFKTATIRNAANSLKREGFIFEVSDKGRIDDTVVTRLK